MELATNEGMSACALTMYGKRCVTHTTHAELLNYDHIYIYVLFYTSFCCIIFTYFAVLFYTGLLPNKACMLLDSDIKQSYYLGLYRFN